MSNGLARSLIFVSSAAVLMLEILAGRLLAPYVGVGLETFTGVIGTVLAAIALGSWAGGRLADARDPGLWVGPAFLIGGILSMLAPSVITVIGPGFRGGGAVAIVAITALAFFLPAVTLSAVSPLVVKLRLRSLEQTGEVVGSLSAVGTFGALVGTFVTGFVLLATLPTRPIVLAIGVVLAGIGMALMWTRQRRGAIQAGVVAFGAGLMLSTSPGPCEWETAYSCANVIVDEDNASGRFLQLNNMSHSYVDLDDPTNLRFRYIKDFVAAIETTAPPGPLSALAIGGGGFTMPRYLYHTRPGSEITVFEIDDALVDIVTDEMALDPSLATVITEDARIGLARLPPDAGFDVIMGDAFASPSVPWHLTTVEFVSELKAHLNPDGVYVMNVIDYNQRALVRAEIATLSEVFDHVVVMAPEANTTGTGGGNFVLVATDAPIDLAALAARDASLGSESSVFDEAQVRDFVGDARPLTDDFAPADQLIDYPRF